ncbi:hypothetical protein, partial [Staphylococcus haemolyticus]|uniref:hypothetical protein n=1 Tax=Staphylococcus haemolyticus TaxID=1283 RepID=UPI003C12BF37
KDNFYIISIEIVFFSLIQELYVPDSVFVIRKFKKGHIKGIMWKFLNLCIKEEIIISGFRIFYT